MRKLPPVSVISAAKAVSVCEPDLVFRFLDIAGHEYICEVSVPPFATVRDLLWALLQLQQRISESAAGQFCNLEDISSDFVAAEHTGHADILSRKMQGEKSTILSGQQGAMTQTEKQRDLTAFAAVLDEAQLWVCNSGASSWKILSQQLSLRAAGIYCGARVRVQIAKLSIDDNVSNKNIAQDMSLKVAEQKHGEYSRNAFVQQIDNPQLRLHISTQKQPLTTVESLLADTKIRNLHGLADKNYSFGADISPRFPLYSLFAPVILAVVMFMTVKSPFMLMFVFLTPLMMFANLADRRRQLRSGTSTSARLEWEEAMLGTVLEIKQQRYNFLELEHQFLPVTFQEILFNEKIDNSVWQNMQALLWRYSGEFYLLGFQDFWKLGSALVVCVKPQTLETAINGVLAQLMLNYAPDEISFSLTAAVPLRIRQALRLTAYSKQAELAEAVAHIDKKQYLIKIVVAAKGTDIQALCTGEFAKHNQSVHTTIVFYTGASAELDIAERKIPVVTQVAGLSSARFLDICSYLAALQPASITNAETTWKTVNDLPENFNEHHVLERWLQAKPLISCLGLNFTLDLEKHGPHFLVGGTTGSGKSELLQSLLLSLAINHPPQQVRFVLIDYKGGASFGKIALLPHVEGLVTDLSVAGVQRFLAQLIAEIKRREKLLSLSASLSIQEHNKKLHAQQLAQLLVVVDELAALLTELPEGEKVLADIAQRGRSLGIFLILATQRPAGVISDKIRANIETKIALRVANPAESKDIIGEAAAATISKQDVGYCYIKTGADVRLAKVQSVNKKPKDLKELQISAYALANAEPQVMTTNDLSSVSAEPAVITVTVAIKDYALKNISTKVCDITDCGGYTHTRVICDNVTCSRQNLHIQSQTALEQTLFAIQNIFKQNIPAAEVRKSGHELVNTKPVNNIETLNAESESLKALETLPVKIWQAELPEIYQATSKYIALTETPDSFEQQALTACDLPRVTVIIGSTQTGKTTALAAIAASFQTQNLESVEEQQERAARDRLQEQLNFDCSKLIYYFDTHSYRQRFVILQSLKQALVAYERGQRCLLLFDNAKMLSDAILSGDKKLSVLLQEVLQAEHIHLVYAVGGANELATELFRSAGEVILLGKNQHSVALSGFDRNLLRALREDIPGRAIMRSAKVIAQFRQPQNHKELLASFIVGAAGHKQENYKQITLTPAWAYNLETGQQLVQAIVGNIILVVAPQQQKLGELIRLTLAAIECATTEVVSFKYGEHKCSFTGFGIVAADTLIAAAEAQNIQTEQVKNSVTLLDITSKNILEDRKHDSKIMSLNTLAANKQRKIRVHQAETRSSCLVVPNLASVPSQKAADLTANLQILAQTGTKIVLGMVRGQQIPWELKQLCLSPDAVLEFGANRNDILHQQVAGYIDRFAILTANQAYFYAAGSCQIIEMLKKYQESCHEY